MKIAKTAFALVLLAAPCIDAGLAAPSVAEAVPKAGFQAVRGVARLIDADTLAIGEERIRIAGIDAPERAQRCTRADGRRFACGERAEDVLRALIGGRAVRCEGDSRDAYGRLIGVCTVGGVDLGGALVRQGWALAFVRFSDAYVSAEAAARAERQGLWAGRFDAPWDWRAQAWTQAAAAAPNPDCPIKGNINRAGERIYHAPWSDSYSRTKIDTAKGERWFCTEADALAAGWRAPVR